MKRSRARVLCVDAGNSAIKFSLSAPHGWRPLGVMATPRFREGRRIPTSVAGVGRLDGVVVSSVVPRGNADLRAALYAATGIAPLFVDHRMRFPFALSVRNPREVGVDRLCAAAGAIGRRQSVIVVDAGSAITIDVVRRRRYLGGLILSGPALSLRALGDFAEKLPSIDYWRAKSPFPSLFRGTRSSMVLGASHGAVGAILYCAHVLERRTRVHPGKVLTGGAAAALRRHLPRSWRFEPHLVQEGLYRLWELNGKV